MSQGGYDLHKVKDSQGNQFTMRVPTDSSKSAEIWNIQEEIEVTRDIDESGDIIFTYKNNKKETLVDTITNFNKLLSSSTLDALSNFRVSISVLL